MDKPIRALRHLSLNERTKIGELYVEGLPVKTIASLYDTNEGNINNTIAVLRKNGVIIAQRRPRAVKVPKQELLILPEEPKTKHRKYANSEKREAYKVLLG